MKTINNKTDYVSPMSQLIEIQGINAILAGSNDPGSVPGAYGQPIYEDDTDY